MMIPKVRKTTRHIGITPTAVGATLTLFGSSAMQPGIAHAAEADAPCEFFFYPEQPGAKIQEGSPLPGRIEVSPGCQFFQFPNKSEAQLVGEPALTELTGTHSHFRITPNGELLFIIEPPKQPAQRAVAEAEQVSECEQPAPFSDQEIERHRAELSRAYDEIGALEARLSEAQTAVQQSRTAEQEAQERIISLQTGLDQLREETKVDGNRLEQLLLQSRNDNERLDATLAQARAAEQTSQERVGSLEAELTQSKTASASQIERHQQTLSESQSESDRLAADLKQSRHTVSEAQQSLEDAKATIAALTAQAAEAAQAAKERLNQATGRIALLEKTGAQARSGAQAEAAKLNADIAKLVEQNIALAPWEGRHQECATESKQCKADLTAAGRQIEQMTREFAATKQELQGLASDVDQDGVGDARDQCPNTPANLATDASGCVSIDLIGVEFTTGSDQLRPTSLEILNNTAKLLKVINFPVEIQGHTDSSGNPQDNQQLSEDRARAVLSYLVGQGVSADRLSAKGYGDTRPIADNETPEGRSDNRRVEITRQR